MEGTTRGLCDTLQLVEDASLVRAVRLIADARTTFVYSSGPQSYLAEDFVDKMARIGQRVVVTHKADTSFFLGSGARNDEVFLVVSYSGETGNTLRVARRVKEEGGTLVALYEDAASDVSASYWIDNRDRTVLQTGRSRRMWQIPGDVPIDTLHDRVGAVADHYNALTLLAEAPAIVILRSVDFERKRLAAERAAHRGEYAAAAEIIRRLGLKKLY